MNQIPIWQRLLALLTYLLPWSDALPFGRALFAVFPWLTLLQWPALPLLFLQQAVPFGSFVLFLVLYLAVVRNPQVPQYLRFNALQAILLDILLVVVSLGFNVLLSPLGDSIVLRTLNNTVFIGSLAVLLYAVLQSLRGKEVDLPTISEAVRMQL
ncbi:Tic20 family protein [Synechococcus sp. UW140]|uniref:Tic20 family protein n=1 Tax=Synechococcus sp. UW140 TaxID=368503 RepID=UPI00313778A1